MMREDDRDSDLVTAEMILNETLHTEDLNKSYQREASEAPEDQEQQSEPDDYGLDDISEEESKLQETNPADLSSYLASSQPTHGLQQALHSFQQMN